VDSLLTIFTTPKPFIGHNKVIQTNAIRSWCLLRPECEIIIFGNEEGTAEIASELGTRHIPEIECNEMGTPLVSSLFSNAQTLANHQLLCYINADIILMSDFFSAVQRVDKPKFLMVGQRWDLEQSEPLNFNDAEWESRLLARVAEYGRLHPKTGIDYFVFPRGLFDDVPPFAIGRTAWDLWLIYRARARKAAVIDATRVITVVHQNHDYSHNARRKFDVMKGPEAIKNQELAGKGEYFFTLEHATWTLTPQGIRRAMGLRNLYFRLDAASVLYPYLHFLRRPMKALTKLIIYIRSVTGITRN
jgi:hypothetical protein